LTRLLLEVLIHGLAGGLGVVAFSLIAETLQPKDFAGLFSAAPSIALASLLLAVAIVGPTAASRAASGMLAGAVGMIVFCTVATVLVVRYRALRGTLLALPIWFVCAAVVLLAAFR
jgi:hypothetical protein